MSTITGSSSKKWELKMPHAFVILLGISAICAVATWIIPGGSFERVYDEGLGRYLVVPGSYMAGEARPVGVFGFFRAIYDGMLSGAGIIFSIIFSATYVFTFIKTGAMDGGVGRVLRKMGDKDYLLIPVFMTIFAAGGSALGMINDTIGFIPAFVALALMLRFDKIVGGAIVYIGTSLGFAAATINPFTVVIASEIAGIPLMTPSLVVFRILVFIVFVGAGSAYVMWYAKRIRKDPEKSLLYGIPNNEKDLTVGYTREELGELDLTRGHKLTLVVFLGVVVGIVVGISKYGFGIGDISTVFLIGTIITAYMNKYTTQDIIDIFIESTSMRAYTMIAIGLSYSIGEIMNAGNVVDTVVYYMSNIIAGLPESLSALGMLLAQNIINVFIPSGSGQAVVTMPIMSSIADVSGISREMAVICYQLGDGFSNIFLPQNIAFLAGVIAAPVEKVFKFLVPLFMIIALLEIIFVLGAVAAGV